MKHVDTYAYQAAKVVMDNDYDLQMELSAIGKEGLSPIRAIRLVERAAASLLGYSDEDCPPISQRTIHYYAIETVEDWQ